MKMMRDERGNIAYLSTLYDLTLKKWYQRQVYEREISILAWGLTIISFVVFIGKVDDSVRILGLSPMPLIISIVFFIIYYIWMKNIWMANDRDKMYALFIRKKIDKAINPDVFYATKEEKEYPEKTYTFEFNKFIHDYSFMCQLVFELFLLTLGNILISNIQLGFHITNM